MNRAYSSYEAHTVAVKDTQNEFPWPNFLSIAAKSGNIAVPTKALRKLWNSTKIKTVQYFRYP